MLQLMTRRMDCQQLCYWEAARGQAAGHKECGRGKGPTLNIASSTNGYMLAHRGTRPSFKNRGYLAIWSRTANACSTHMASWSTRPGNLTSRCNSLRHSPTGSCLQRIKRGRGLQDRRRATVLYGRQAMMRQVLMIAAFVMAANLSETMMAKISPAEIIIHAAVSLRGTFIDATKA